MDGGKRNGSSSDRSSDRSTGSSSNSVSSSSSSSRSNSSSSRGSSSKRSSGTGHPNGATASCMSSRLEVGADGLMVGDEAGEAFTMRERGGEVGEVGEGGRKASCLCQLLTKSLSRKPQIFCI